MKNEHLDNLDLHRWREKRKAARRGLFLFAGVAFVAWSTAVYLAFS